MANTIDWGKATQNNTNGFGKYQNTIDAGSIYADSYAGETAIVGTSAAFSYSKSSYHQDEADPTPTITGTTGGTFNASAGLVFVDTGTHNSTTGQIDLSASTIDSHIITYTVDGVQSGQTVGVTASPFIPNNFSMDFDYASLAYINVGNISALNAVSNFSISVWVNPDNITGNNKEIFTIANSTSQALVINHYNNDLIYGVGHTGTFNRFNSALTAGVWAHLCFVFDGSQSSAADKFKLYKNGVYITPSSAGQTTTVTPTFTGNAFIGAWALDQTNFTFDGKMDEFAIWNTSLSSDAVQEIYNATANNTGKALDLTQDSGNYNASSNLQYFNRLGD